MTSDSALADSQIASLYTAPEPPVKNAVPAATLVIMRHADNLEKLQAKHREAKHDEILMVRRAKNMAFAAGAMVFPGGRVDKDDYLVAQMHGFETQDVNAASRVAALRETLEETGLAVGWEDGLDHSQSQAIRRDLLGEVLLSDILQSHGARLNLAGLHPFARWCPKFKETRIFDTRFFAVKAPQHTHELSVDHAEHSHIFWSSAQNSLTMADRREISIIFPTRRNLERIACYSTFEHFVKAPAPQPIPCVTPWIEKRGGKTYLCIAEGLGYPKTSEPIDKVTRG